VHGPSPCMIGVELSRRLPSNLYIDTSSYLVCILFSEEYMYSHRQWSLGEVFVFLYHVLCCVLFCLCIRFSFVEIGLWLLDNCSRYLMELARPSLSSMWKIWPSPMSNLFKVPLPPRLASHLPQREFLRATTQNPHLG
jgi:hypothetical protein